MAGFDDAMNNFNKRMKESGNEYNENMRKIDERYEKKKKEINRKFNRRMILLFSIIIFLNIRNGIMINVSSDFKGYSKDYSKTIKTSSEYDEDITYKKLLPSYISSFVNPLEWTEKQISKNDELLRKCKIEYEIKEKERQLKRTEAERTFNKRVKE